MRIVRRADARLLDLADHFSGDVVSHILDEGAGDAEPLIAITACACGSVSAPHRHTGRQLVVVLDGRAAVVADRDEPHEIEAGSLVVLEPGERHRHGAAASTECTVLTLTWGETEWEPVA